MNGTIEKRRKSNNVTSDADKNSFKEHLKKASEIVKTWPLWKQNCLGGTFSVIKSDKPIRWMWSKNEFKGFLWFGEELGRHECQLEKIPRPLPYVKPTKEEIKRRDEEAKKILTEVFRKQKLSDKDWLKESHESFISNYIKEQT